MKKIHCEVCGATDLIKKSDVFECQYCGMKYSVEEARKMLVEGTVKVDNSEQTAKFLQIARTAKDEDDSETAAKYYGLIREEYPDNWEAKFYSTYYTAMECTVAEAYSMCIKLEKILPSVLTSITNNEPEEKQVECVLEVSKKMDEIALMFHNGNSEEATAEVPNMLLMWGDLLEERFGDIKELTDQSVQFWQNAITVIVDTYFAGNTETDELIKKYTNKIQKYDSNYLPPENDDVIHTKDSPNNANVEIIKIGHTDFQTLPFIPIPVQYVAPGPDSAGGVSVELRLKNIKGKTIKYATIYVTALNQMGEPVLCSIHNEATRALSITGPIDAGHDSGKLIFETIWYNYTITSVRVARMEVEYTDGSRELYNYTNSANNNNNTPSSKKRIVTITRNWAFTGSIVPILVHKDGREIFRLKVNESDSFITDDQPFELKFIHKNNVKVFTTIMVESGEEDLDFEIEFGMSGKIKAQQV